jgi:transposase-like protein
MCALARWPYGRIPAFTAKNMPSEIRVNHMTTHYQNLPRSSAEKIDAQFWRVHVLTLYLEKRIGATEAQQLIGIGRSQLFRLLAKVRSCGVEQLIIPSRRSSGNNGVQRNIKQRAINLILERYADHGPTLISEILRDSHSIAISASTIRRWMIAANIWMNNTFKQRRLHQPRRRQNAFGHMVQIDGTRHDWFEGRGPQCCAMVLIDDTTGNIQLVRFFDKESGDAYICCVKLYLQRYGRPARFVTDKFAAIRSGEHDTAFEDGLSQLNINHTHANSPQSKGRVERMNRTLQDRLTKYFRHRDISSIEQANKVADLLCAKLNLRFALPMPDGKNGHRPLPDHFDLEEVFQKKEQRKLSRQLTFNYQGQRYLIKPTAKTRPLAGNRIWVAGNGQNPRVILPDGTVISAFSY